MGFFVIPLAAHTYFFWFVVLTIMAVKQQRWLFSENEMVFNKSCSKALVMVHKS